MLLTINIVSNPKKKFWAPRNWFEKYSQYPLWRKVKISRIKQIAEFHFFYSWNKSPEWFVELKGGISLTKLSWIFYWGTRSTICEALEVTNYKNVTVWHAPVWFCPSKIHERSGRWPNMFLDVVSTHTKCVMNDFALAPRTDLLNFKCHTVTNGTDLRKSPQQTMMSASCFLLLSS